MNNTNNKISFIGNVFYMALPKKKVGEAEWTADEKLDSKNWIMTEFKDGKFYRIRNLLPYTADDFYEVHPIGVFTLLHELRRKMRALKTAAFNYQSEVKATRLARKNLSDNDSVINQLLKAIGTIVDQINGDIVLSCGDLETANAQIVKLFTLLKERNCID